MICRTRWGEHRGVITTAILTGIYVAMLRWAGVSPARSPVARQRRDPALSKA